MIKHIPNNFYRGTPRRLLEKPLTMIRPNVFNTHQSYNTFEAERNRLKQETTQGFIETTPQIELEKNHDTCDFEKNPQIEQKKHLPYMKEKFISDKKPVDLEAEIYTNTFYDKSIKERKRIIDFIFVTIINDGFTEYTVRKFAETVPQTEQDEYLHSLKKRLIIDKNLSDLEAETLVNTFYNKVMREIKPIVDFIFVTIINHGFTEYTVRKFAETVPQTEQDEYLHSLKKRLIIDKNLSDLEAETLLNTFYDKVMEVRSEINLIKNNPYLNEEEEILHKSIITNDSLRKKCHLKNDAINILPMNNMESTEEYRYFDIETLAETINTQLKKLNKKSSKNLFVEKTFFTSICANKKKISKNLKKNSLSLANLSMGISMALAHSPVLFQK